MNCRTPSIVLLVATAAALMAFAGTASAAILTSPEGTTYTGAFKATSENVFMHGPYVSNACGHSLIEGEVEEHGSSTAVVIKLSNLTFDICGYSVTVLKRGWLQIHSDGTVRWSDAEVTLHTSVGKCVYTTNNTLFGDLTGSASAAVLEYGPAKMPRTGGNFLCGSSGTWTGTYWTTPSNLWVD